MEPVIFILLLLLRYKTLFSFNDLKTLNKQKKTL